MSEVVEYQGSSIEIRRIELGGKNRPVAFTMYTYILFKRQTGIDFFSLSPDDSISLEDTMRLYHCALCVGGIVAQEDFEIDFEPQFMAMCDTKTLNAMAGIKESTEQQSTEEEDEEKNGESHSPLKTSKKAVAEN